MNLPIINIFNPKIPFILKHFKLLFLLIYVFCTFNTRGQAPTRTAKDYVRPYTESFQYGTNLGYYNATWSDDQLATVAQTLGSHSVRPTLPESFVEQYGYGIRATTFNAYVNTYGMKELTCFVEGPAAAHRDMTTYPGCGGPSKLFAHLYEPIWNADGSVNANNYYAIYLYKLLQIYGDKVRFWEVVNEPDFTTDQADIAAWTTRAPQPGELANIQAPVYHYVRMLRISYEVIKKYRPDAYITTGGVGYAPFVDALLRYTDNPNGGAATADYPHTAGAYLDALSFHSYPSYSLHHWDTSINGFRYTRSSDYAVAQMLKDKQDIADVLTKHGYGTTYPAKHLLMSETNIGRRTSNDRTGTDEMQRNYGIKALVLAQKNSIKQFYIYQLGESVNAPGAGNSVSGDDELALMGLFENLKRDAPGAQKITQLGQAFSTTSKLLYDWHYDAARTAALALPSNIEGAAFGKNGTYTYVLWAKALTDNSEHATASYSFPAAWNLAPMQRYEWDHAATNAQISQLPQSLSLSGTPIFLREGTVLASSINPARAVVGASVTVTGSNLAGATQVSFNGTMTTAFTSNSATQLVLNVPSGATSGSVTVITPNGTSNSVAFTVEACPVATLAYGTQTYCQSGANPTPTVTGPTGGAFTSTTGLSLDAATGVIALAASSPGTYTVTYNTSTATCTISATAQATITAAPLAAFAYSAPAYCANAGTAVAPVLGPGATAGTFTAAPAGLALDANTGAIALASSQPGTYTVTNALGAGGGCAAASATAQVTIDAAPVAAVTAAGPTTFCQGGSVTLTASGGTGYQWSTGATTSSITVAASGTYGVTVTSAAGCSAAASSTVTVNPLASAAFGYAASSYCTTAANPVPTVTGTAGGTFASASGLVLDAATGAINLAGSTPGAYTVTYTTGTACPVSATAQVTLAAPATAGFGYGSSSFCAAQGGVVPVALATGAAAGTFSSTAGLVLDASTGAITPGSSSPGAYTVTNTVASAGGCGPVVFTNQIVIEAAPATPTLTAAVQANGTVLLTSSAGAGNQFYLNGTALAGATASTYMAAQNGAYTVTAASASGCASAVSAPEMVNATVTATARPLAGSSLSVYPSPTPDGRLTIELAGYPKAVQLTVINALGQVVHSRTLPARQLVTTLELHNLPSGVYTLRAQTEGGVATRRFVRQ